MGMTTLCYIEKDNKYLMLHRIKKEHDINKDKWIGVGGHFKEGESPEECMLREVREETGLTLTEPFSGTPAIVADRRALGDILPPNFGMQSTENAVSMRLIPFSSLGADGVLPAFRPDAASLSGISIECWVAVTDRTLSAGSFQALVGAAVCDAAQIQGLKPGKDIP